MLSGAALPASRARVYSGLLAQAVKAGAMACSAGVSGLKTHPSLDWVHSASLWNRNPGFGDKQESGEFEFSSHCIVASKSSMQVPLFDRGAGTKRGDLDHHNTGCACACSRTSSAFFHIFGAIISH